MKSQVNPEGLNCKVKKVLYVRVSSIDQNPARQLVESSKYDFVIEDKVSGAVPFFQRTGGAQIKKLIDSGAKIEIYASHVDRAGRNLIDTINTLKYFAERKINFIFYCQGLRLLDDEGREDPIAKLILSIMISISMMNRLQIRENQALGIRTSRLLNPSKFAGRRKGTSEDVVKFLSKPKNAKALELIKKGYKLKEAAILSDIHPNTATKIRRLAQYKWNSRKQ